MSKNICPFLKKTCIEYDCALYTHVQMMANPQTGVAEDKYGCALAWAPLLQVANMQVGRGVQAAVESARNEITQRQDQLNALASGSQKLAAPPDMKTIEGG